MKARWPAGVAEIRRGQGKRDIFRFRKVEWRRVLGPGICLIALAVVFLGEKREFSEIVAEEEVIPMPVRIRKTWLMKKGWQIILREGRPGSCRVLTRYGYRGGRVVSREEIERKFEREPRREVRLLGVSSAENPINAPRLTRAVKSYRMLTTAYDPGPKDNTFEWAGITKLGWRTRRGIVAVDPKVIPLRRLVYIEEYGLAWTGDVGAAIKGNRLDLCFNTTEEALAWGRRSRYAYVLEGVTR